MKDKSNAINNNQEVITFKVSESLGKLLMGMKNRSEFIRNAILVAMESACPVCRGTGVLTPHRAKHWSEIIANHTSEVCSSSEVPVIENSL